MGHLCITLQMRKCAKKMLLRLLDESQEFAVVTFNNLGYNLSFEQSEAAEDEEKKPEEHNIWNYFQYPIY